MFGKITNFTLARPNDSPTSVHSMETATTNDRNVVQIPETGVVYGLIFNFKSSSGDTQTIVPEETESLTSIDDAFSSNGVKLVRKKRFLGSALRSLQSDSWRECGRTVWGTTIYTNSIATACFGACPENVYCGYGYDGYGRYGNQISLFCVIKFGVFL